MATESVEFLVRRYLKQKGLHEAAEMLSASAMEVDRKIGDSSVSLDSISDAILFESFEGGICQAYFHAYDCYRHWACNSLDNVKSELISVCYPLFVNCYITLIRKDFGDMAREFFAKFEHGPPDLITIYGDELRELSKVTAKDHLRPDSELLPTSGFIRAALNSKFRIRLSTLATRLLADFLQRDENLLLASIVNEKIEIVQLDVESLLTMTDLNENTMAGGQQGENIFVPTQIMLPGYSGPLPAAADSVNHVSLFVQGRQPLKILGCSSLEPKSVAEDRVQIDMLRQLVRPQVLLSRKRKLTLASTMHGTTTSSASGSASAAKMDEDGEEEHLTELEMLRQAASEPTVLFSTIVNAADSLICMHISSEARQVAGGFRDNSVKLWYLDESNESGLPGRLLGPDRQRTQTQYTKLKSSSSSSSSSANGSRGGGGGGGAAGDKKDSLTLEFIGHTKPVYGVAQDSTSRFVLSASGDETVRLWDTAIAQCVGKYPGVCPFWGVAFSSVGYYFATANQDKSVSMYSTDRAQPLRLCLGHISDVTCVDWHHNSTLIASGSDDRTCRLWDIRTGNTAQLLQGCPSAVASVSCSKDGRLLAAGTDGGSVHVWDLLTGKSLALCVGHTGPVHTVAFSEESSTLASGGADCSVRVWSLNCLSSNVPLPTTAGHRVANVGTHGNGSAAGSDLKQFGLASSQFLLSPMGSYNTKYTPVYYLNYTSRNMIFAGGPFAMANNMN